MGIGIIGAGRIGGTLARHFVDAGHKVAVSNSRGPGTLADLVQEPGAGAQATTPSGDERFGRSSSSRSRPVVLARCRTRSSRARSWLGAL